MHLVGGTRNPLKVLAAIVGAPELLKTDVDQTRIGRVGDGYLRIYAQRHIVGCLVETVCAGNPNNVGL